MTIYSLHLDPSRPTRLRHGRRPGRRGIAGEGRRPAAARTGDARRCVPDHFEFGFRVSTPGARAVRLLPPRLRAQSGDRNGRPHDISVAVRRNGVTLRSRRQFTIEAGAPRTAEGEILRGPARSVARGRDSDQARGVLVPRSSSREAAAADCRRYRSLRSTRMRSCRPDTWWSTSTASTSRARWTRRCPTAPGATDRSSATSAPSRRPGKYTVKFAVVDDAAGQRRTARRRAADAAGPIRATDLLLADGLGRAGTLPLAPAVTGELTEVCTAIWSSSPTR